jgi:hypothetical protein
MSEAKSFILTNSKTTGSVRSVTQSSYLDYLKEHHQITPETVHALKDAEVKLVTGAIEVATEDLAHKIKEAKKAGEDPQELHGTVKIARPDGQLKIDVDAHFESRNPKTQESLVTYGRVSVRAKAESLIDDTAEKRARDTITKLMGG